MQRFLMRLGENAISLLLSLIVLWFLLKYLQMLPQPIGGIFGTAQKLATPGGV